MVVASVSGVTAELIAPGVRSWFGRPILERGLPLGSAEAPATIGAVGTGAPAAVSH
jgi:hypothetical protein